MSRRAGGRRTAPRRGFSIVDLLIGIVIIGILVTIAFPYVRKMRGGGAGAATRLSWVVRPDSSVAPGDSAEVAVRVEDGQGRVVPGAVVEFQTATGAVDPDTATSDATGVVPATWRFGADPGRVVLTARVRGQPQVASEIIALVRGAP